MPQPFRNNIPAYSGPPDRVAWTTKHGTAPYSLGRVRDAYVSRALGAIRRDHSSIEFDGAIDAQVRMDEICQRVQAETELPETTVVFFDPADESFWAYPARG
jgi:hypothetical protein